MHEAGVAEHLEVEGEPGLRGVEAVHEIADAALAVAEHVHDPEPRLVGERMEELGDPLAVPRHGGRHDSEHIKISCYVKSQLPLPLTPDP